MSPTRQKGKQIQAMQSMNYLKGCESEMGYSDLVNIKASQLPFLEMLIINSYANCHNTLLKLYNSI